MAAPISLRGDFDGPMLRALVLPGGKGRERHQAACYLSSRSMTYGSRADAARLGAWGCRPFKDDWVLRFEFQGPDGLVDGKSTGHPSKLNDEQGARLSQWSRPVRPRGPWGRALRLIDLAQWVFDEYRISVTKQILSRELRALGYRKLLARAAPLRP